MRSKIHGIGGKAHYATILGSSPSKGARSLLLWNAVFSALEIDCVFGAYDVVEEELGSVVNNLKTDPAFIGGAVAVPYKTSIIPFLDEPDPEAEKIGAVNALHRDGKKLVGTNTDGQGAVSSLVDFMGNVDWLQGKRVLLLGVGGAGKAVATYLARECGSKGTLWLWNRTESRAAVLAERLKSYACTVKVRNEADISGVLPQTDLLVNCTTVGSADQIPTGAVGLLDEVVAPLVAPGVLAKLPSHAIVFDIIYRPPLTTLLKLASSMRLRTLNGLGMNLEQAAIACHNALLHGGLWKAEWSKSRIREIMRDVP